MRNQLTLADCIGDLAWLPPDQAAYPAWCTDCGGQWLVFRSLDAPYSALHIPACQVHREWSPRCREDAVRVGRPITISTLFPKELEDHADSPFV